MGTFLGIIIIIACSLYILFNGKDLIQKWIKRRKKKKEQKDEQKTEENQG